MTQFVEIFWGDVRQPLQGFSCRIHGLLHNYLRVVPLEFCVCKMIISDIKILIQLNDIVAEYFNDAEGFRKFIRDHAFDSITEQERHVWVAAHCININVANTLRMVDTQKILKEYPEFGVVNMVWNGDHLTLYTQNTIDLQTRNALIVDLEPAVSPYEFIRELPLGGGAKRIRSRVETQLIKLITNLCGKGNGRAYIDSDGVIVIDWASDIQIPGYYIRTMRNEF